MAVVESGSNSAGKANVNSLFELNVANSPDELDAGFVCLTTESDGGSKTGVKSRYSPETDDDYRLRIAHENILDSETFNYTAQNTGKHNNLNTTMTFTYTTGGLQTNSAGITTTTTGVSLASYAMFPMFQSGQTLYAQARVAFSAQPQANTIIDFGVFMRGAANPYAPTDGAYFRLSAAGLMGVINHNGTETTTSVFDFTYANADVHQFVVSCEETITRFWIDDILYASIPTPVGQGAPFMSASLPFAVRHAIVGGVAGGDIRATIREYSVSTGGVNLNRYLSEIGNAVCGSFQGLSGGTMGSLANYANSANPTAAVPTNTTAALGVGLGGQFWETDTLAVTTDGIICSYQIPAGTVSVAGKRLVIYGVKIESFAQTALTGGGYNANWSLAFGHTAVSLATAESATTKAPRRVPLGSQSVASGLTALTALPSVEATFRRGIYGNPGEFIAVVKKKVGTAPSAGVIAHLITFDYAWE